MLAGNAAPHDHLPLTGGSIGQGIPLAGGAAMACPDRKVICLRGVGGAITRCRGCGRRCVKSST